jgi:hypothetical protein
MANKKGAGGAREGAGRPPKILEIKLIEQMDAICVPDKIWEALLYKCKEGDTAALKLWLSYRFGMPKQQIDVTSNGEKIAPPIQWIGKNIAIESAKVVSDSDTLSLSDSDTLSVEPLALHGLDHLSVENSASDYLSVKNSDTLSDQNNQFDIFI